MVFEYEMYFDKNKPSKLSFEFWLTFLIFIIRINWLTSSQNSVIGMYHRAADFLRGNGAILCCYMWTQIIKYKWRYCCLMISPQPMTQQIRYTKFLNRMIWIVKKPTISCFVWLITEAVAILIAIWSCIFHVFFFYFEIRIFKWTLIGRWLVNEHCNADERVSGALGHFGSN